MYQVIEMSHREKMKMYMKCTKKKLAEMLIECNRILDAQLMENKSTAEVLPVDVKKFIVWLFPNECIECGEMKKVNKISSNLLVSRSVAEFAFKMSKAMEDIASSNVFFMMQQAYTEDVMYDYRLCQEKWKELQDELRQHFC